jgi:hypothetical protein
MRRPHPSRPWLTTPTHVDRTGIHGPTPSAARRKSWRRTSKGLYVPADVDGTVPEQRVLEAAAVLPAYGGVTGWGALRWAGGVWFDGITRHGELRPVDLATGMSSIRSQPGFTVSTERLNPKELIEYDSIMITSLVRAACFEMRYARSLADAVVVLDMAAYSDLVSIEEMTEFALAHPGWTGIPQCREALRYADENSWSPPETLLRLIWSRADELPPPITNRPIFDLTGRHLGTPDLFEPRAGLAVEYDGKLHLEGSRRASDLDRDALMRSHGIETLVVVGRHLSEEHTVRRRIRDAHARALRNTTPRSWTLDQPSWWQPTHTVALRRALTAEQRDRWLAHRLRAA